MSYAKHAIRVTDLGEFVRHKSCQRRFKLGYDDQALFKEISTITGAPFATIDPVLAEHGKAREEDWARDLVLDGFLELDLPEEEEGKGAPWEDFASLANQQAEGQDFFAREVQIIGIVGAFNFYVSVAQNQPFRRRFIEMCAISGGVALLSYGVAIVLSSYFDITVAT